MIRIAATGAGTATTTGFFKALRQHFEDNIELIGFDVLKENSATPFADVIVKVPLSTDPSYPTTLLNLCNAMSVDLLIPILDQEFITLQGLRKFMGDKLFLPTYAATLTNKESTYNLLQDIGCQTPEMYKEAERKWQGKKMIWRPTCGAGARGVKIISGPEDMPAPEGGILTEFVDGPEYTVDFLASEGLVTHGAQRKRVTTRGGVSTIAEVDAIDDDVLIDLETICNHLRYEGPGCFQFIRGQRKDIYWTDLNPRVGGGTMMTVEAGLNLPAAFICSWFGYDMPSEDFYACKVIRYFQEVVLL